AGVPVEYRGFTGTSLAYAAALDLHQLGEPDGLDKLITVERQHIDAFYAPTDAADAASNAHIALVAGLELAALGEADEGYDVAFSAYRALVDTVQQPDFEEHRPCGSVPKRRINEI